MAQWKEIPPKGQNVAPPEQLEETVYLVNEEVTSLNREKNKTRGVNKKLAVPAVVEVQSRTALAQCRQAQLAKSDSMTGESLGVMNIFRPATPAEVKAYKAWKEAEIAKNQAENLAVSLKNAPNVVMHTAPATGK